MEFGLLILRLLVGLTIAGHGAQKLFGWFGGYGLEGTGGWLESLGFKPGKAHATLTGLSEFGGGLLIALGLLTPLGAAAIVGVMIVAIATVHWEKGFFNTAGGYELNLLLIGAATAVTLTGPGRISIDNMIGWDLAGSIWGSAALTAGALTAILVLAVRRPLAAEPESDLRVESAPTVSLTDKKDPAERRMLTR